MQLALAHDRVTRVRGEAEDLTPGRSLPGRGPSSLVRVLSSEPRGAERIPAKAALCSHTGAGWQAGPEAARRSAARVRGAEAPGLPAALRFPARVGRRPPLVGGPEGAFARP